MYFDVLSARAITADIVTEPVLEFIVWLDPDLYELDKQLTDEAEIRETELDQREAAVSEREEEISQLEEKTAALERELNARNIRLNQREAEINAMRERTIPLYRRDMTPQELEDMISYSTTFSRMSPDDASEILVNIHTTDDVASILYYMSERNAAAIMAAFEPEFAAEVTNVWLYN